MDFSNALNGLQMGHKVRRENWTYHISLTASVGGKVIETSIGEVWVPTQVDILAEDWELV